MGNYTQLEKQGRHKKLSSKRKSRRNAAIKAIRNKNVVKYVTGAKLCTDNNDFILSESQIPSTSTNMQLQSSLEPMSESMDREIIDQELSECLNAHNIRMDLTSESMVHEEVTATDKKMCRSDMGCYPINMDNYNLFAIKIEPTELIIKNEPEESSSPETEHCSADQFPHLYKWQFHHPPGLPVHPLAAAPLDFITAQNMWSQSGFAATVSETPEVPPLPLPTLSPLVSCSTLLTPSRAHRNFMRQAPPMQPPNHVVDIELLSQPSLPFNSEVKNNDEVKADSSILQWRKCDKRFSQHSFLKTHMLIHEKERPFKCEDCDKRLTTKGNLQTHMLIHVSEKPFECEKCDKTFAQKANCKIHMLLHSRKKPFICEKCGKCFAVNSRLKAHMLIDVQPFKCQQCDKNFAQKGNLRTHMLIHEGKKPFECQQCNKCFALNSRLKAHMLIHKNK